MDLSINYSSHILIEKWRMEVELSFKKLQLDVSLSLTYSKNSIGESGTESEGQLITLKKNSYSLFNLK